MEVQFRPQQESGSQGRHNEPCARSDLPRRISPSAAIDPHWNMHCPDHTCKTSALVNGVPLPASYILVIRQKKTKLRLSCSYLALCCCLIRLFFFFFLIHTEFWSNLLMFGTKIMSLQLPNAPVKTVLHSLLSAVNTKHSLMTN